MRDAFGGVFMFRLFLVFIVIYVAFTAISFKYAKSFKIKNSVIDLIETNQIIDIDKFMSEGSGSNMAKLDNILAQAQYDINCENIGLTEGTVTDIDTGRTIGYCHHGVVIIKNLAKTTTNTTYYNIYTYVNWDVGALNMILKLDDQESNEPISGRWRISGEAVVAH